MQTPPFASRSKASLQIQFGKSCRHHCWKQALWEWTTGLSTWTIDRWKPNGLGTRFEFEFVRAIENIAFKIMEASRQKVKKPLSKKS
jgi:hypothetical protein